jgi:hypothetical protein
MLCRPTGDVLSLDACAQGNRVQGAAIGALVRKYHATTLMATTSEQVYARVAARYVCANTI